MFRRRPKPVATLDDIVEYLHGIGSMLMRINANLHEIVGILNRGDDEEADT